MQQPTQTPTPRATSEDRKRRRKALMAWGVLAGVAALTTTAAFTDVARLSIGADGLGGADGTYNIQVGATDAAGSFVAGQWQEADGATGAPVSLIGDGPLVPGGQPTGISIPVRNASPAFDSTLTLSLETMPDDGDRVTDADYLDGLRFYVGMASTTGDSAPRFLGPLTYDEAQDLPLNSLAALEESVIEVSVMLTTPAGLEDNDLNGKAAHVQVRLDGASA